jgi:hypothetical protein
MRAAAWLASSPALALRLVALPRLRSTAAIFLGSLLVIFFFGMVLFYRATRQTEPPKLLDAVNSSPAFDGFVFARFPIDEFRHDLEARLDIEAE